MSERSKLIMFKPKQVTGSWPSPDILHFWRSVLRPAIRLGEAKCSLCAWPLEKRSDDPVQVVLSAPPEPPGPVVAVTICCRCGDDDWNCFRPEALERALTRIAGLNEGARQ
jgi:hypothetical protein